MNDQIIERMKELLIQNLGYRAMWTILKNEGHEIEESQVRTQFNKLRGGTTQKCRRVTVDPEKLNYLQTETQKILGQFLMRAL